MRVFDVRLSEDPVVISLVFTENQCSIAAFRTQDDSQPLEQRQFDLVHEGRGSLSAQVRNMYLLRSRLIDVRIKYGRIAAFAVSMPLRPDPQHPDRLAGDPPPYFAGLDMVRRLQKYYGGSCRVSIGDSYQRPELADPIRALSLLRE